MAVGEQRHAKTLRQKAGMENAQLGRLPLTAMPGGLWRHYGSANEGKANASPTAGSGHSVLGW